jgi:hypothetical protein
MARMSRLATLSAISLAGLALLAPEALAQAGGGSSGFSGGGGGGGFGGGGGGSGGGGGVWLLIIGFIVVFVFVVPAVRVRKRRRARAARDERVSTASAEAAEDDPAFAAQAVKADAAALYVAIQQAWSERDDAALERMLGPDLLVEWRRRLADFDAKGWVDEVAVRSGPEVQYVGLGDRWRLLSIEQEAEGAHHLDAPIVASPWSDDARVADESLVELATADAPPAGVAVSELVVAAPLDHGAARRSRAAANGRRGAPARPALPRGPRHRGDPERLEGPRGRVRRALDVLAAGHAVGALAARRFRERRRVSRLRRAQVRVSFLYVMRCGRSASSPSSSRRCSS